MKVASIFPPDATEELILENGITVRLVENTVNLFAAGAGTAWRTYSCSDAATAAILFGEIKKQLK